MYLDESDGFVNKCNNTYHRTIKMKPIDVKISIYVPFDVENNEKDSKSKVGDHVKTSKYKDIFCDR